MSLQKEIAPILEEIHDAFWENDENQGMINDNLNEWTPGDMAHAAKIFSKVVFEMSHNINNGKFDQEEMNDIALYIGQDIYRLVKEHTKVDLHKFITKKLMSDDNYKGWNLRMFRQLFAEMNPETTFTAKELNNMFSEAKPLFTEEQLKDFNSIINK